jgi:hypothetical protein
MQSIQTHVRVCYGRDSWRMISTIKSTRLMTLRWPQDLRDVLPFKGALLLQLLTFIYFSCMLQTLGLHLSKVVLPLAFSEIASINPTAAPVRLSPRFRLAGTLDKKDLDKFWDRETIPRWLVISCNSQPATMGLSGQRR